MSKKKPNLTEAMSLIASENRLVSFHTNHRIENISQTQFAIKVCV